MIVIKNVFGGSKVYIKNVFANAENLVVVYNGGDPIEITGGGGGSGDVVGPASATDNAIARFNLTTGKLIQNSGASVDDSGNITATNLSGTNTGDQDLSGYEPLRGADDNYVTDAEKIVIGNTSGTNTGDQDLSVKQDTLVSGTNIKTVNSTSLLGSGNIVAGQTIYDTNLELLNALGANIKAQTHDVKLISAATFYTPLDRELTLVSLYLPVAATITGVKWIQHTQGNYTGDQYNGWGLFTYSGGTLTLVASTTNNSEIWKATALTTQTVAFSGTYSAAAGVYYLGALYNQSAQTTAPVLKAKLSTGVGIASLLTNSAKIAGYTLNNNTLPATLASSGITETAVQFWAALY